MTIALKKLAVLSLISVSLSAQSQTIPNNQAKERYPITPETKPWTRWWWQGNALTKQGITYELEAFQKAGLGGVEITPIYGVHGYEQKFINYLSPEWMSLLDHVLAEANRLGLQVDMATGTGWPFGGPWVNEDDACKTMKHRVFTLTGGSRLNEPLTFKQEPYIRFVSSSKKIDISELEYPIEKNKDLQALAIDQIQFERSLPLKLVVAYSSGKKPIDLTAKVRSGFLDWTAPAGEWKVYAVFEASHGKLVERAGPGGEGNVIDHFSAGAVDRYLQHFDSAFKGHDIKSLRSFFNDSYEVDDARGASDFTAKLFDEFRKRIGYDLRHHLPALFSNENDDYTKRIRSDYRETISQLVLENFTARWKQWAHSHDALVRNQAHGSPANILDLYSVVDIPEIEGEEPLRIKMASSSGNVTGKRLVSAEAATWENEHFKSKLSDVKRAVDKFLLHGVNHVVYHGTAYSPPDEPWPGWLFYAAVHFNMRNPLWEDFDALNQYVARSQAVLQNTKAEHDILLYYPIYDPLAAAGAKTIDHFDGIEKQFHGTLFAHVADSLQRQGYTFDFISDRQILNLKTEGTTIVTEGLAKYKVIVVPKCEFIPLSTFEKITALVEQGATVVFIGDLPSHTSGFLNFEKNERTLTSLKQRLAPATGRAIKRNNGVVIADKNLERAMSLAKIDRESVVDQQIQFLRKKDGKGNSVYFLYNPGKTSISNWITLQKEISHPILTDPFTGTQGEAKTRASDEGKTEIWIQLLPEQMMILASQPDAKKIEGSVYTEVAGTATSLTGPWKIEFISGGPRTPEALMSDSAVYYTKQHELMYKTFSGRARYTVDFSRPTGDATRWLLKFKNINESAEVFINGRSVGTMIGPIYQVVVPASALNQNNRLEIYVSNTMANRIVWMDQQGLTWKKFYNVNFPARKPENSKNGIFSAATWTFEPSGVTGAVTLQPLKP